MEALGESSRELFSWGPKIGEAGEGAVYRVQGKPKVAIKKFFQPLPPKSIAKIQILSKFPKKDPAIAFPIELISDLATKEINGFLMPLFDKAVSLTRLLDPISRQTNGFPNSLFFQVRLCRLIAERLDSLHRLDLIQGDVSDNNFLIGFDSFKNLTKAYIVDSNSFQVSIRSANGNETFPSGVATEPYTAHEIQNTDWKTSKRTKFSDSFGLAVLIWQILFNDSHPYSVITPPDIDPPPIGKRIADHMWPYSPGQPLPQGWRPPDLDPPLAILPKSMEILFYKSFSSTDPRDRPLPEEFLKALYTWELGLNPGPVHKILNFFSHETAEKFSNRFGQWRPMVYKVGAGILVSTLAASVPIFATYLPNLPDQQEPQTLISDPDPIHSKIARNPDPEMFPTSFLDSFGLNKE